MTVLKPQISHIMPSLTFYYDKFDWFLAFMAFLFAKDLTVFACGFYGPHLF